MPNTCGLTPLTKKIDIPFAIPSKKLLQILKLSAFQDYAPGPLTVDFCAQTFDASLRAVGALPRAICTPAVAGTGLDRVEFRQIKPGLMTHHKIVSPGLYVTTGMQSDANACLRLELLLVSSQTNPSKVYRHVSKCRITCFARYRQCSSSDDESIASSRTWAFNNRSR